MRYVDTNRMAGELIECLKQQADQFRQFLDLLARQREALVQRDARTLERIVATQEAAIAESRRLEQRRRALTAKLAASASEAPAAADFKGIMQLVEASDASRLAEMRELLSDLQKEVEHRKRLNATLVEQSIRCSGEALQWIARRTRPIYGPRGDLPGSDPGQITIDRHC